MSGEAAALAPAQRVVLQPKVPAGKADLHQSAVAFEGMLMSMLFQNMRKTVQPSGLLGDSGQARSTFEYLFDQAVADSAMKGGRGWGLAAKLEESWARRDAGTESTKSGKSLEKGAGPADTNGVEVVHADQRQAKR